MKSTSKKEGARQLEEVHSSKILYHVDLLLGNDLKTNNETTSASRQQSLNKQVYTPVTKEHVPKELIGI
jgi:hypothetical protein